MSKKNRPTEYLGDSVYVEVGSYLGEFILTTNNGYPDDPRNRIVMELRMLNTLLEWLKAQGITANDDDRDDDNQGDVER